MDRIVKFFGAFSVIAGAVVAAVSLASGQMFWAAIGLSWVVSGALLYCQGALVSHMRDAAESLRAIRAAGEIDRQPPASATRAPRPTDDISALSGVFRER